METLSLLAEGESGSASTGAIAILTTLFTLLVGAVAWFCNRLVRQRDAVIEQRQTQIEQLSSRNSQLEHDLENERNRPTLREVRYPIVTLGISGSGKTALTLKWTNPTIDVGLIAGTKLEVYEKPISIQERADDNSRVIHIFSIQDRGGEFAPDVQESLIVEKIQALLMVVDLAEFDPREKRHLFSKDRIKHQLDEFNHKVLKFFFTPKGLQHCKQYILFINKVDVLQTTSQGSPQELEALARQHYKPLIDSLEYYGKEKGVKVHVIAGSALTGQGTPELYAHMINGILPLNAWDKALSYVPSGYVSPTATGGHPAVAFPNSR